MRTLIKGGLIYDGTGAKPYKGDVLIEDDVIVDVAPVIRKKPTKGLMSAACRYVRA